MKRPLYIFVPGGLGAAMFGVPGGLLLGMLVGAGVTAYTEQKEARDVFGSARYANEGEIRRIKLLNEVGVIVGEFDGQLLRYDGDRHILIVAPTRAGKGVGIIIPTLLAVNESVFVVDIKGENWLRTSGKRSEYGPVFRFEPTSATSARYNPIDDLRRDQSEVADIQSLAKIICDQPLAKDKHWADAAGNLLTATILYLRYSPKGASLGGALMQLTQENKTQKEILEDMLKDPHPKKSILSSMLSKGISKTETERANVFNTLLEQLAVYYDPILAKNTETSDFSLRDLYRSENPVSIYLVVPPSELDGRLQPLVRMMVDQAGRVLTEDGVRKSRKQRVILVLDEFAALGHMRFFDNALSYLAGYGVRAMVVCQSVQQLSQLYGPSQTIADNCFMRVFMTPNSVEAAQYISRNLGKQTVRYSSKRNPFAQKDQLTGQPLLTEEELLRFPENEQLVFVAGSRPIRCHKLISHEHPLLEPHFKKPPEETEMPPWEEEFLLDGDDPGTILEEY